MVEKTNKLNICLVKSDYTAFDQIVEAGTPSIGIEGVGTFYVEESHVRRPSWVDDFFGNALDGKFKFLNANSKGVLLTRIDIGDEQRIFAVVFGHGRYLLKDGVIEDRFGLKVVLNTVVPTSLRSIDKLTLGSVPKQSREQISRAGAAANFGIDIEEDLLRAVTGSSKDPRLGKTISGKDALSVSVQVNAPKIHGFLQVCFGRYKAEDYKADFDWIDQIKDLRDRKTIGKLDTILFQRLKDRVLDKIWMAPPDILDWVDVKGFRYAKRKQAKIRHDLNVNEFLAELGDVGIDLNTLTNTSVFAISATTEDVFANWKAYRCIYAELEYDGKIFLLNNGKWYEVAKSFTDEVITAFNETADSKIKLPDYAHDDEGAYNEALPALIPGSHCMDRNFIMHGGGHNKIEFCDLLTKDKCLIHVKRYSGSQQLSHLFSQGVVAGQHFVQDASFRQKLNDKLPAAHKLANVSARPDPREYEIVFAIISKSENPLDIPFFSKVSLKNARKQLEGYGYRVTKKKISSTDTVAT